MIVCVGVCGGCRWWNRKKDRIIEDGLFDTVVVQMPIKVQIEASIKLKIQDPTERINTSRWSITVNNSF
jgi:hypothetical protein